ncbi:hypothetical protein Hanom_Chr04g00384871 [Helianthus anomalus]
MVIKLRAPKVGYTSTTINFILRQAILFFFFFFERQIWITDGPLEYHRVTSRTTRSYPSPLDIMPIHQFRRKPDKYWKNPLVGIEPRTYLLVPKPYLTPKTPLGYKAMGRQAIL